MKQLKTIGAVLLVVSLAVAAPPIVYYWFKWMDYWFAGVFK